MTSAQRILDQVYSLAGLVALEGDKFAYSAAVAAEVPAATTLPELEARDAALARALGQLDAMLVRAMKLRLEHALADDQSIGPPTRAVFAHTITSYAGKLSLLEDRARDASARGGAGDPGAVAKAVVAAAYKVLALGEAMQIGVLAVIRELAEAAVPLADRQARDPALDEPARRRWSAARRDLEAVAADPLRVTDAPMAQRMAELPEQLDDPAPEPERSFADFIELD
ncbi:MAG TPA: hypothetical protein VLM79_28135 [Kofleriaceae bacterium]|nr:hypothetical protein [Kofleriaceae bacterium]